MDKTKKIATYGVMAALAMILSYVEMQLPAFVAIPGVKMGLTNIVVIVALYKMGNKSAIFINIVRIIAVSLLFGTLMSFAFSLNFPVSFVHLHIFFCRRNAQHTGNDTP